MKPLLSIADVKALLPIRPTNTDYDARIKMAILAATSQIEAATRRRFDKAEVTEFATPPMTVRGGIDLNGSSLEGAVYYAKPVTFPLAAITIDPAQPFEVRYDPNGKFGDDTVLAAERYALDAERCVVTVDYPMRYAFKALRFTYTGGLEATETSPEWSDLSAALSENFGAVKYAAQMQALHLYNKSSPETVGKVADGTDGSKRPVAFQVPGGLIPEVVALLRPYRRLIVGRG